MIRRSVVAMCACVSWLWGGVSASMMAVEGQRSYLQAEYGQSLAPGTYSFVRLSMHPEHAFAEFYTHLEAGGGYAKVLASVQERGEGIYLGYGYPLATQAATFQPFAYVGSSNGSFSKIFGLYGELRQRIRGVQPFLEVGVADETLFLRLGANF
ncbi:MAG: hypothetical protein K6347_03980 [Campylobacterales bacterium]